MLSADDRPRLNEYLAQFVRTGLAEAKGRRFSRKHSPGLLIGTVRGTRSGHAFVTPDDEKERLEGDLYIGQQRSGSAIHGDKVIARVIGKNERGREGRIEVVLDRTLPTVVGRFVKHSRTGVVSPIDERFWHDIEVAPNDSLMLNDGDIVNVEITRAPVSGQPPRGRVIEVLGNEDTDGIDVQIIIRKHHLAHTFSENALKEAGAIADEITESELRGRIDLRDKLTVTIDGENARDFDDAVSLEITPQGKWLLGVHIADVGHYVPGGSALDEEAFARGTSTYFPEMALPMLPDRLSNDICSLKPRVDRLTISALMELDRKGRIVDYRLTPSIIRSRERLTYAAVRELISNPSGGSEKRHAHVLEMLLAMNELTLVLITRREHRGAIDFELPEAEIRFNDEGRIAGIVRAERNIAHRLIEEFMLLVNETVAAHLGSLDAPTLYRIHEEPKVDKVEEFAEIAESFGHKFSLHGPIPQRGFQRLTREIRGLPEERMLSYLMLRSMQRARYSAQNLGHYGLAMKAYCHFTSPIRRYPDLVVHRVLREVIERGKRGPDGWGDLDLGGRRATKLVSWPVLDEGRDSELRRSLETVAEHSSERERAADDAERELMEWRKTEFMAEHVGDEFDAVITTVKEYGFYVELDEYFVEGLVHIATLADDTYLYQERKHRLEGLRTGRIFRLGDRVRVSVDRVDRTRRLVDFSVVRGERLRRPHYVPDSD